MANIYFKNGQLFKNDEVILDSDNTLIVRNKPLDPGRGGTFVLENPAVLGSGVDFVIENMGGTGKNVVNLTLGENVFTLTRNAASDFILNINTTAIRLSGSLLEDQSSRILLDNVGNAYIHQDSKLYIYSNAGDNRHWDISRDIVGGTENLIILNNTTTGGGSEAFRIGTDNEFYFGRSASTPSTLGGDLFLQGISASNGYWNISVGNGGTGITDNVLRIYTPTTGTNILEFTPSSGINLKDNLIINDGFNITNKFSYPVIESTVGSIYSNCTSGHQFFVNGTAGHNSSEYWYMYADNSSKSFVIRNNTGVWGVNAYPNALIIDEENVVTIGAKNGNPGGQGARLFLQGITGYDPYYLTVNTVGGSYNQLSLVGPAGTAMYFTNAGEIHIQHIVNLGNGVDINVGSSGHIKLATNPSYISNISDAHVIDYLGNIIIDNGATLTLSASSAIKASNTYNIIASNGSVDINAGGGNVGILSFLNSGYADLYSGSYIKLQSGSYIRLYTGSEIRNNGNAAIIDGAGNIVINSGVNLQGDSVTNDFSPNNKAIISEAGDIYIRPSGALRKTAGSYNSQYRIMADAVGNFNINYESGLYITTSGSGESPTYGICINWNGDIYVQSTIKNASAVKIIDSVGNIFLKGGNLYKNIGTTGDILIDTSGNFYVQSTIKNASAVTIIDSVGNIFLKGGNLYKNIGTTGDILIDTSGNFYVQGIIKRPNGYTIIDSGGNINVDGATLTAFNSGVIQLGTGGGNTGYIRDKNSSVIANQDSDVLCRTIGVISTGRETVGLQSDVLGSTTDHSTMDKSFTVNGNTTLLWCTLYHPLGTVSSLAAAITNCAINLPPAASYPGKIIYIMIAGYDVGADYAKKYTRWYLTGTLFVQTLLLMNQNSVTYPTITTGSLAVVLSPTYRTVITCISKGDFWWTSLGS